MYVFYLCCLPAPLAVFGIVGEPPHVPVGLDDLGPQDVVLLILPYSHRLQAAVELKGLRAELQHLRGEENGGGGGEEWRRRDKERWRGDTERGKIKYKKGIKGEQKKGQIWRIEKEERRGGNCR